MTQVPTRDRYEDHRQFVDQAFRPDVLLEGSDNLHVGAGERERQSAGPDCVPSLLHFWSDKPPGDVPGGSLLKLGKRYWHATMVGSGAFAT